MPLPAVTGRGHGDPLGPGEMLRRAATATALRSCHREGGASLSGHGLASGWGTCILLTPPSQPGFLPVLAVLSDLGDPA